MNPLEIEDFFSDKMVFQNGFKDTPTLASLGAYGTVISYEALYAALDELFPMVSEKEWKAAIEYWEHNAYLSPTFMQLALAVGRKLKEYAATEL